MIRFNILCAVSAPSGATPPCRLRDVVCFSSCKEGVVDRLPSRRSSPPFCDRQEDIIIDAKSGVSGAGRSVKQAFLYTEIAEGMNAYGVSRHRHMPEIEQVGLRGRNPQRPAPPQPL